MSESVTAHPSATVVLLREAAAGFEMLLLQRAAKLAFHGGAWVFPGGRIDAQDYREARDDLDTAARCAAVRETHEEAGLAIDSGGLIEFARWTTPDGMPRRFVTWYFAAAADGEVQVDGGEIKDHRWLRPAQALAEREVGALELPPPTFVTTTLLEGFPDAAAALDGLAARGRREYLPRLTRVEGGACSLYQEDAGYADADPDPSRPGPRHRLWMLDAGWRYERSG
jgi:8-oxo-dGTP pyrophosphatase MutT (NUDIX family)